MATCEAEIDQQQALSAASLLLKASARPGKSFLTAYTETAEFHSTLFPGNVGQHIVQAAINSIGRLLAGDHGPHVNPELLSYSYSDLIDHYLHLFTEPRMAGSEPISAFGFVGETPEFASVDNLFADLTQPHGKYPTNLQPQGLRAFVDILSILELRCLHRWEKLRAKTTNIWSVDRYNNGIVFLTGGGLGPTSDNAETAELLEKFFDDPNNHGCAISTVASLSPQVALGTNGPVQILSSIDPQHAYRFHYDLAGQVTAYMIEMARLKWKQYQAIYNLAQSYQPSSRPFEQELIKTMPQPDSVVVLHLPLT